MTVMDPAETRHVTADMWTAAAGGPRPSWPPLGGWLPAAVRPVLEELDRAVLRRAAEQRALAAAEGDARKAADQDLLAAAQAMRAGRPDPGDRHAAAAARRIADARRQRDAADLLVASLARETAAAVRDAAPEWQARVADARRAAADELHVLLDETIAAAERLRACGATLAFIDGATRGTLGYKPGIPQVAGSTLAAYLAPLRAAADEAAR